MPESLTYLGCVRLSPTPYSCRQKWCPEYEAGLERTAAEPFDAATQDRSTTDTTMRVGVDRRAKRPQRWLGVVKANGTVTAKQR